MINKVWVVQLRMCGVCDVTCAHVVCAHVVCAHVVCAHVVCLGCVCLCMCAYMHPIDTVMSTVVSSKTVADAYLQQPLPTRP